jgi:serine/threonine-protein kinase HipA
MDIDIHLNGSWHACATVQLEDPLRTSQADGLSMRYDVDYALEHLYQRGARALSVRWPVDLGVRKYASWPPLLADVLPRGDARARLERREGGIGTDWSRLQSAVNPVGNFRVRPSKPRALGTHAGFELREIAAQGTQFLDHAAEAGAQVIGATDVAGEAPKFWAVEIEEGRWLPDDGRWGGRALRHVLIKFPDPAAGPQARDILRLEAAYQQVAQRLGLYVAAELPQSVDGMLLIHRFDRRCGPHGEVRLGVESLRSVIADQGDLGEQRRTHLDALLALHACVSDFERDLLEYLRRDILNLALGNRDNEPGNSAVLKDVDGSIRLAPLYDFGPSFLDARPITRALRWEAEGDRPMDWDEILGSIAGRFAVARRDPGDLAKLADRLRDFAQDLGLLPQLMAECGVDDAVIGQRRRPIEALTRALAGLGFR